jgi:oxygen-independent coproporphyrinogen III oxidase
MAGVYISWPFCSQKCTYCNFASGVFPKSLEAEYTAALLAEIREVDWPFTPETVYLGGGTPSNIPLESLAQILAAIPGRPWPEATLEAAPGSFTPQHIEGWRRLGINRVSLGVQSFNESELRRTARKHTAQTVIDDVANLRAAGIENFNIDLIAGLALQTPSSWLNSLQQTLALHPPHVSVYMLEVDEDSRLGLEILNEGPRYGAREIPSDAETAEMYQQAAELLQQAGIPRYEISNFARPGRESLHNLKYWQLEPYLGFGADAHSFSKNLRWQNPESPQHYVQKTNLKTDPTPANPAEERFFVGLRLAQGIEPTEQELSLHKDAITKHLANGLLERYDTKIRLTPRGILVSNEVFQDFLLA